MTQANVLTARNVLNLDLEGVKLIEASAGTGKTYTIANLYCRYVLKGFELKHILLVTFTNAATDELKQRIRQRLKAVYTLFSVQNAEASDDEFLQLLLADFKQQNEEQQQLLINRMLLAIRSFDESAIHTINGFCQRMLNDYAFKSAQHYELNVLISDDELWQSAIKDWWRINTYTLSQQQFDVFQQAIPSINAVLNQSKQVKSDKDVITIPKSLKTLQQLYQEYAEWKHQIAVFKTVWEQQKNDVINYFKEHKVFKKNSKLHGELNVFSNLESVDAELNKAHFSLPRAFEVLSRASIYKNILAKQKESHPFFDSMLFQQAEQLWNDHANVLKQFKISAILNAHQFATEQVNQIKLTQQSMTYNDQMQRLYDALFQQGSVLAEKICDQFPVALIDEFQDTNAIQYDIFHKIYQTDHTASLILIGDPKQAIYSFRGGDIFTYLKAKQQAGDQCYNLLHNWRSSPALIDAVNQFFLKRDDAFVYSAAIPFDAVKAGSEKAAVLKRFGKTQAALSLWHLKTDLSSKKANEVVAENVANEISQLINEGQTASAVMDNIAVKAGDIAILVRSHNEGKLMAKALQLRGIQAINIGKDKVLQSDAAKGLNQVLKGIAESDDVQAVRNMLASRLFRYSYQQIEAMIHDDNKWLDWVLKVKNLHHLWLQEGFIAMFYSMLIQLNLMSTMVGFEDAERQITNVLHISEILQTAAKKHATPQALCSWLQDQIYQPDAQNDEQELRLDSDAELVKIVTVHKSKGLEYPIVFVPFLWRSKPLSKSSSSFYYHNDQQQSVVDYLLEGNTAQASARADKERLAEDMRLLYVAMTRAISKCYCVTGQASNSGSQHSALSFLMHPAQSATELNESRADIKKYSSKNELSLDIEQLANESKGCIDFKVITETFMAIPSQLKDEEDLELQAATFKGDIRYDWHISSFSRMTRDVHQVAHGGHLQSTSDDIFNFKRGGDAGTFLHHILELLDFSGDISEQTRDLFQRFAARYSLDDEHNKTTVIHWMKEIVNTDLNKEGLRLSSLKMEQRLDELEFNFSLQTVDIEALNQFLKQRSSSDASLLTINNFKGMMTGFIDLVFEYQGKYYIADYKSNFLGTQLSDYSPDKLNQAITDRRYDLQYLLYSLALHRYLSYRLPSYNYHTHFGGVYYLFLRAMREKTGEKFGIFFDQPSLDDMNELDQKLFKIAEVK